MTYVTLNFACPLCGYPEVQDYENPGCAVSHAVHCNCCGLYDNGYSLAIVLKGLAVLAAKAESRIRGGAAMEELQNYRAKARDEVARRNMEAALKAALTLDTNQVRSGLMDRIMSLQDPARLSGADLDNLAKLYGMDMTRLPVEEAPDLNPPLIAPTCLERLDE